MKPLALFLFILTGFSGACAQTILLKNGQTVPANGLTRTNDMIMVSIKTTNGTMGQIGYQISDIAQLNLPEPEVLTYVTEQVANGDYKNAMAQLEPLVAFQKSIRDIPGNLWAKSALVEVSALIGLNRIPEATALSNEISGFSNDPEILTATKLKIALITKFTDPKQALTTFDSILSQSSDVQTLSQAWIAEGDVHFGEHEFDEALMAYLTVPVFYPDHNPLVPKALWGSGQSYAKLKDMVHALKTYHELVDHYPGTPEASLARAEIQKKENKT